MHGHCGVLRLQLEAELAASEMPVRTYGCSSCSKQRARYTSDPPGRVVTKIDDDAAVSRYRFGLGLADVVVCRVRGVFVSAEKRRDPGRRVRCEERARMPATGRVAQP
jgi:hypothetical protein